MSIISEINAALARYNGIIPQEPDPTDDWAYPIWSLTTWKAQLLGKENTRGSIESKLVKEGPSEYQIEQRIKQLHFGRGTPGYSNYHAAAATNPLLPRIQSPNPEDALPKRMFDQKISIWRKNLHQYDERPPESKDYETTDYWLQRVPKILAAQNFCASKKHTHEKQVEFQET